MVRSLWDKKQGEIAEELKISKNTLSNWLNADKTPAFLEEYDRQLQLADAIARETELITPESWHETARCMLLTAKLKEFR